MDKFRNHWPSAFGLSVICHGLVLGAITGFFILFPPQVPNKNIIEVDLVTDIGGGGGGGGGSEEEMQASKLPEIHTAQATPTAPPPTVPVESDSEAENDLHQMAPPPNAESSETPIPEASTPDSSSEGNSDSEGGRGIGSGTGSGGGHGSGIGTGTGSGYGPGTGSGSGGGNGSGHGTGNGDGEGPGDGSGGGETMGPQLLSAPEPSYPESARRAGVTGTTVVGMTISTDGSVSSAWVEGSSGNSALDSAAVNAVYSWRFVPAKQNGTAITVNSRVPVTFNLN
ncbi:energy transducer TonB [Dialister sp.]|uniref:energy transducer TonB n=1 Tax=Dialister sp. TaxID=1955814 RepID=UPI002E817971|nr:energy transducer TonB [Dialister sp.]MEE3452991.1 energy transducer TonB [Dialister sp.]